MLTARIFVGLSGLMLVNLVLLAIQLLVGLDTLPV